MSQAAVAATGLPAGARPRRRLVTPWRLLLVGLLLAGGLFGLWRTLRGQAVQVMLVERAAFVERVVASGRVMAPAEVRLGTVVLGKVARVHVEEGQRVKAGELLVELDDTEAQAALAQARSAVAHAGALVGQVRGVTASVASQRVQAAEARYELALRNHERQQQLAASGAVTAAELDQSAQALEVARSDRDAAKAQAASAAPGGSEDRVSTASVAQAQSGQELALARLALLKVTAPADGVVLVRDVEPGDVVSPGQTLLLLARDGPTRLAVQVDEANLGRLTVGQLGQASADAYPAERFEVKVASIAPSVDAARGTVEVKLEVANPPTYLRPNMTVSVDVEVARRPDVIAIPTAALRDGATAAPWVWVVAEGRFARRPIRLGVRTPDRVEILAGLEPGELLVLPGNETIADGARALPTQASDGGK